MHVMEYAQDSTKVLLSTLELLSLTRLSSLRALFGIHHGTKKRRNYNGEFCNFFEKIRTKSKDVVAIVQRGPSSSFPRWLHFIYNMKTRKLALVQCIFIVLCHFVMRVDS